MQKKCPKTAIDLLQAGRMFLRKHGIVNADYDAALLLSFKLQCSYEELYTLDGIYHWNDYKKLLKRRIAQEPVSYITGHCSFWKYNFFISSSVLDPRQDSETLVQAVLEHAIKHPIKLIADLGIGSGCLLFSILMDLPDIVKGIGIDNSYEALKISCINKTALHLDHRVFLCVGFWGSVLASHSIDVIISNPPYIKTSTLSKLGFAKFEPHQALDGGPDGLCAYKALIPNSWRILKNNGWIFLEIGAEQKQNVESILKMEGFILRGYRKDIQGIIRVIIAQKCLEQSSSSC